MSGVSIGTYVLCVTSPLSLAVSRVSWLPLPVRVEGGRRQKQGGRAAALINGRAELLVFIGLGNPLPFSIADGAGNGCQWTNGRNGLSLWQN